MQRLQRHPRAKTRAERADASDRVRLGLAGLLGLSALVLGQAALGRILLLISP